MHASDTDNAAPNVLDLEVGQYIAKNPDGSSEVRAFTGVQLFIAKNCHIPSFYWPMVIEGYLDHPEFYESGEFWNKLMGPDFRQQVADVAVGELMDAVTVGGLLDAMPNEAIRKAVADLMVAYNDHMRAKCEQGEG